MSTDPNLNALWCRAIAEELRRAGAGAAFLCPGSRNSPLVFALANVFGQDAVSHWDERAAAFAAVGAARASGRPAIVCVTSGTAVAECLPAVCEAWELPTPLIVLAADRPWELQGRGAPQTTRQQGIFVGHADEIALGEPIASEDALTSLRSRVSRAAQSGLPVVLHVPLRDPLPPVPDPAFSAVGLSATARAGRGSNRPFTACATQAGLMPPSDLGWWAGAERLRGFDVCRPGLKGLIVAGAVAGGGSPFPLELARTTGYPLLAEVTSNQRREGTICTYDVLVSGAMREAQPDLIIQIGPTPLHRATWEWIRDRDCPLLLIDDGRDRDWLDRAWATVSRPHPEVWHALGVACADGDPAWLTAWQEADRDAQRRLHLAIRALPWCETLAAHAAVNHPAFPFLHLAASMPVRHANLHAGPLAHGGVFSPRGVNGIDGTIAAFAGGCRIHGGNGLLVIGDIALLHDLTSLSLAAAHAHSSAIVVLNNDGGGIFDHLPLATVAGYERWIRTPHGRDFAHAAAQFGLPYTRVTDRPSLDTALSQAAEGGPCQLIECDVRGLPNVQRHRDLVRTMTGLDPTPS